MNEITCKLHYSQIFLMIHNNSVLEKKNCLSDGSYRGTKLIDLKAISDEAIGKCKDQ